MRIYTVIKMYVYFANKSKSKDIVVWYKADSSDILKPVLRVYFFDYNNQGVGIKAWLILLDI